jgi:hypothetical protein
MCGQGKSRMHVCVCVLFRPPLHPSAEREREGERRGREEREGEEAERRRKEGERERGRDGERDVLTVIFHGTQPHTYAHTCTLPARHMHTPTHTQPHTCIHPHA